MAHLSLVPALPMEAPTTAQVQTRATRARPAPKAKKKSAPHTYTHARHRWLTNLAKGLVPASECRVTDMANDWDGIIAYPSYDIGTVAARWLCDVREWWQLSRNGHPGYRVLKLTESGRRTLNQWDQKHGEQ